MEDNILTMSELLADREIGEIDFIDPVYISYETEIIGLELVWNGFAYELYAFDQFDQQIIPADLDEMTVYQMTMAVVDKQYRIQADL